LLILPLKALPVETDYGNGYLNPSALIKLYLTNIVLFLKKTVIKIILLIFLGIFIA